jgi:hypothetical protein
VHRDLKSLLLLDSKCSANASSITLIPTPNAQRQQQHHANASADASACSIVPMLMPTPTFAFVTPADQTKPNFADSRPCPGMLRAIHRTNNNFALVGGAGMPTPTARAYANIVLTPMPY